MVEGRRHEQHRHRHHDDKRQQRRRRIQQSPPSSHDFRPAFVWHTIFYIIPSRFARTKRTEPGFLRKFRRAPGGGAGRRLCTGAGLWYNSRKAAVVRGLMSFFPPLAGQPKKMTHCTITAAPSWYNTRERRAPAAAQLRGAPGRAKSRPPPWRAETGFQFREGEAKWRYN